MRASVKTEVAVRARGRRCLQLQGGGSHALRPQGQKIADESRWPSPNHLGTRGLGGKLELKPNTRNKSDWMPPAVTSCTPVLATLRQPNLTLRLRPPSSGRFHPPPLVRLSPTYRSSDRAAPLAHSCPRPRSAPLPNGTPYLGVAHVHAHVTSASDGHRTRMLMQIQHDCCSLCL